MIKPGKLPTRGKLRATSHYHGDGVFSMFRSLGQFSPRESHGICDYQLWGFFTIFMCGQKSNNNILSINNVRTAS